jgi:vitamin B12 transporter
MEVPIERVAASITVIGREEIERMQWRTLPDLLDAVPGLHVVQSGGPGGQTSVFLRGTNSNHALVLLDGIEVSDPSQPGGLFDIAHLLTDGLERVEVLRGPQSTLYGSDAVGGVINIISSRGRGERTASGWAEAGAFNTMQQAVGVRGGGSHFDYALNYASLHTRGISAFAEDLGGHERDGYDNRSTSLRVGLHPTRTLSFNLFGRLIDTDIEIDPFQEDRDYRGSTRQLFLRGEGQLELLGGAWRQSFGVSYADHDRKDQNDPDVEFPEAAALTHDGRRLKFDWQHDLTLHPSHIVTLGLETERESLDARSLTSSAFQSFASEADESLRTSAVFLQEQFEFGDRLFGTLGLRLDHHDEFGSHLTYRVAAAYVHPDTGTKLRASVATAFKAPSLNDLFGRSVFSCCGGFTQNFRGNPDLDPEKSRGFEIGIEQPLWDGRVRLGVTYFQSQIRDLIQTTPLFDSVENIARARMDGVESFASLSIANQFTLRVDHTYTMAEDRDSSRDLLRRPAHKLSLKAELRPIQNATLSLAVVYTGHRKDIDALSFDRTSLGGYTVTDVAATYQITPRWRAFGRVDNLFDREYDDPDGFGSPGIAGYVGVKAEY